MTEPLAKAKRPKKTKQKEQKGNTLWPTLPSRHKDVLFMLKGDNPKFKFHNNDDSANASKTGTRTSWVASPVVTAVALHKAGRAKQSQ